MLWDRVVGEYTRLVPPLCEKAHSYPSSALRMIDDDDGEGDEDDDGDDDDDG